MLSRWTLPAASLGLATALSHGAHAQQPDTVRRATTSHAAGLPAPPNPATARAIPTRGALGPNQPPPGAPPPRPLATTDKAALEVLFRRPSPMGPVPIPVTPGRAIYVVGRGPLFRQKVGPIVYADRLPAPLLVALNGMDMFSNDNVELPRGEVRFAAFDLTSNDTKLSRDSMALEATLTDERGDEWRVLQIRIAPLSPDPVNDPWYGGLAIDTLEHGDSKRGTPEEPKVHCTMCSWGWADVWKNGVKVASSAPLHVMLSSQTHDPARDWAYKSWDASKEPVTEVHLVIPPDANLPSADGSLHVMWEGTPTVVRGTPAEVKRRAPVLQPLLRTITLNAVPTLQWNDTKIQMEAGVPIRLIVNNLDPSSFHGLHIRGPDGLINFPLPQGDQWTTNLVFDQPGEYYFYCPVSNHERRGMYGRFVVSGGVPGGTVGPPGAGATARKPSAHDHH